MTKLIKNWEELAQVPSNDKYKIIVDEDMCCGWIVPICDEKDEENDYICHCEARDKLTAKEYYANHIYLSTHTFYGSMYQHSTKILQEHGFNVQIDNWDKEVK